MGQDLGGQAQDTQIPAVLRRKARDLHAELIASLTLSAIGRGVRGREKVEVIFFSILLKEWTFLIFGPKP